MPDPRQEMAKKQYNLWNNYLKYYKKRPENKLSD